jgi:hypothetical protein
MCYEKSLEILEPSLRGFGSNNTHTSLYVQRSLTLTARGVRGRCFHKMRNGIAAAKTAAASTAAASSKLTSKRKPTTAAAGREQLKRTKV